MEEKDKSRVTVQIMGEEFILRGSSSPEEMYNVGSYVDRLMRSLAERNLQMSRHKIAVLAALNLADELLRLKEELRNNSGKTKERGGEDGLV
ncbi:MAG: cell division protein ZapA [Bacillota bacterium]